VEDRGLARLPGVGALAKVAQRRKQSLVVRSAVDRVDGAAFEAYLVGWVEDAPAARRLVAAVDEAVPTVLSLSSLTSPLALDYLDRLTRPIPALTPMAGVQILTRSYVAHLVTEHDPGAFGGIDVPGPRHPAPAQAGVAAAGSPHPGRQGHTRELRHDPGRPGPGVERVRPQPHPAGP
jgi:hypothetical protein